MISSRYQSNMGLTSFPEHSEETLRRQMKTPVGDMPTGGMVRGLFTLNRERIAAGVEVEGFPNLLFHIGRDPLALAHGFI